MKEAEERERSEGGEGCSTYKRAVARGAIRLPTFPPLPVHEIRRGLGGRERGSKIRDEREGKREKERTEEDMEEEREGRGTFISSILLPFSRSCFS